MSTRYELEEDAGFFRRIPVWVLSVGVFDLLIVGLAIYFDVAGRAIVAGITFTIALFIAAFAAALYAVIWWMQSI